MIKPLQWTSLYFLTLMLLFFTSCDSKNNDEKLKLQENTSFKPNCGFLLHYSAKCTKGQPACGSKPGEHRRKVHCIDGDGIILSDETAFCEHNETKQPWSKGPSCVTGTSQTDPEEHNPLTETEGDIGPEDTTVPDPAAD